MKATVWGSNFYQSDWQQGYEDAMNGFPRALGGTRSGYRAGYDKGLSDKLKQARPA